jgi:beta-phosphoglucomutase
MKKIVAAIIFMCSFSIYAKPTAVLFDCDGVLVNTPYMKYEAWKKALKEQNVDITIDEYRPFIGHSLTHIANAIAAKHNFQIDQEKLIATRDLYYKTEQKKGVPLLKPGIAYLNLLLENKRDLDIKIAVVSSDTREAIMRNLEFAGVKYELLDGVFSGRDDLLHINDPEGTNKPKPYVYQLAAQKLGIDPQTTVVFEDSSSGVIAAHTAGMIVVAVPNVLTDKQDFAKANYITAFEKLSLADIDKF